MSGAGGGDGGGCDAGRRGAEAEEGAVCVFDFAGATVRDEALHGGLGDRVPRRFGVAGAFGVAGEGAADDEAILRARERDVEQAAMFPESAGFGDGAESGAEFDVAGFRAGPDRRAVFGDEDAVAFAAMGGACVGQDDDGGFEALGAVDSHHADFILRAGEFALHFAATAFDGVEEDLEAGGVACVEGGGAVDQGGDGFARGAAEAGEDQLPAGAWQAMAAFEGVGKEFEGRLVTAFEDVFQEGRNGDVVVVADRSLADSISQVATRIATLSEGE